MPLSSVGRASLSESEGPRFEAASGYQSCCKLVARGQGGYGPVCKTGETGSTPVRASILLRAHALRRTLIPGRREARFLLRAGVLRRLIFLYPSKRQRRRELQRRR